MAITPVATYAAANDNTADGTAFISTDASVQAGHLLYAEIAIPNTSATITPPDASWNVITVGTEVASTQARKRLYWHVATGGSQTYGWVFSSGQRWSGFIRALAGVDTTSPVDIADQIDTATGVAHVGPSVTTTGADRWIVTGWAYKSGAFVADKWAPGPGLTELAEAQGTNNTVNVAAMLAEPANPLAAGSYQYSATSDDLVPALKSIVAFKPAATGGGATVALAPLAMTLTGVPLDAAPGPSTVLLAPAAVSLTLTALDPQPGPVSVDLVPLSLQLDPQPVATVPGPVTVALTPVALALTAVELTIPETIITRPDTGSVARPGTGSVTRPFAGVINYPVTSIARPDNGDVPRP